MASKKLILTWIGVGMFIFWVISLVSFLSIPGLYDSYTSIKNLIPDKLYEILLLLYLIMMVIFIFSPLLQSRRFCIALGMLILEFISLWWSYIFDPSGSILKFRGQFIYNLHFIYIHLTNLFFIICLILEAKRR